MSNIALREWQKRNVDGTDLTDGDRRFLKKLHERGVLSYRELGRRVEIGANRYVGLIQLENGALRIEPKIENHRLLWMIDYGSRLNQIRTFNLDSLAREGSFTLPDLIFLVFLRKMDEILRQGLHKSYISVRDKQKHLRGKLLLYENIVQNHCPSAGIWVEHDELTHDVLENRIMLAALRVIRRFSRMERIRRSAERCLSGVLPVVDEVPISPSDCRLVRFNRLNRHYRAAIDLAGLILEHAGLEELSPPGRARVCSFLVNMDSIFQDFLNRLLSEHLLGYEVLRIPHYSQFIRERETGKSRRIQPDFILSRKAPGGNSDILVADAKYKTDEKPSISDLYQIFFYSLAISGRRGLAYLIYPGAHDGRKTTVDLRSKESLEIRTTVRVIKIPLLQVINYLSANKFKEVKSLLRELFREDRNLR